MNDPTEQKGKTTKEHFAFLDSPDGIKGAMFMLLLCFIVFVAYDLIFDTPQKEQWVPRTFANGTFEISLPASWETKPSRSGDFWIDPHSNISVGVRALAKAEVKYTTLHEFREQQTAAFVTDLELTDVNISHVEAESKGDSYSLDTIMSATLKEKKVTFLIRHFDFEEYWVEACVMVVEGNPKRHEETFQILIRSVRHT